MGVGGLFAGAALALMAFIVKSEYPDVGYRMSRWLVAQAARSLPLRERDRWHDEWLAEIEATKQSATSATGLLFAGHLFASSWIRLGLAVMEPAGATAGLALGVVLTGRTSALAVAINALGLLAQMSFGAWLLIVGVRPLRAQRRIAATLPLAAAVSAGVEEALSAHDHESCRAEYDLAERAADGAAKLLEQSQYFSEVCAAAQSEGDTQRAAWAKDRAEIARSLARQLTQLASNRLAKVHAWHVVSDQRLRDADRGMKHLAALARQCERDERQLRRRDRVVAILEAQSVLQARLIFWGLVVGVFAFYAAVNGNPVGVSLLALHVVAVVWANATRAQRVERLLGS